MSLELEAFPVCLCRTDSLIIDGSGIALAHLNPFQFPKSFREGAAAFKANPAPLSDAKAPPPL